MDHRTNSSFLDPIETIAAISTPPGEGGIGVIRLTGPLAIAVACRIFRRGNGHSLIAPRAFRLYHGYIFDPQTDTIIDEVLLSVMRAPRSYTREDVVEINGHGGMAALQAILRLLCAQSGVRLAHPGEFTQRAFLNGRIDLTQAEAVMDVIRAHTDAGLHAAEERLRGQAGQRIRAVRERVIALLASLEAAIDYADEDLIFLSPQDIAAELLRLRDAVEELIASYAQGHILREGAATVIIGRPNTGKSSLLNALLGEPRAIVTAIPGTTRDAVEEMLSIEGVPLRLLDTAGIRQTHDEVEQIGVERSRAALETADLVLPVFDRAVPLTEDDHQILALVRAKVAIAVLNKADLPAVLTPDDLGLDVPVVTLSAQTGEGMDALRTAIRQCLLGKPMASPQLATLRQREAADRAAAALGHALETLRAGGSEELIAVDAMEAAQALGEITGETAREDVIDELFARFCIGK